MVRSWQYVAGFFDGEGCAWWCVGRSVAQASMSQRLSEVLYAIKKFLAKHKIKSSIRTTNRCYRGRKKGTKPAYSLEIQGWSNVVPFLKGVLPYLETVKRVVCSDILRAHKIFPQLTGKAQKMLILEGIKRRKKSGVFYRRQPSK